MENIYSGVNSVTEYLGIKKRTLINIIVWAFLGLILFLVLFIFLMIAVIDSIQGKYDTIFGHTLAIGIFIVSAAVMFVLCALACALIISEIIRIKRTNSLIKTYMSIEITNVAKVLIDYDTKQWLTAPKDTYHPLAFHLDVDGERLNLKTQAIFTNSSTYCRIPRHKMPEILKNKNYINNYALVGYYAAKKEGIIISIIKD